MWQSFIFWIILGELRLPGSASWPAHPASTWPSAFSLSDRGLPDTSPRIDPHTPTRPWWVPHLWNGEADTFWSSHWSFGGTYPTSFQFPAPPRSSIAPHLIPGRSPSCIPQSGKSEKNNKRCQRCEEPRAGKLSKGAMIPSDFFQKTASSDPDTELQCTQ